MEAPQIIRWSRQGFSGKSGEGYVRQRSWEV